MSTAADTTRRVLNYLGELFAEHHQSFDPSQALVSSGRINSLMLFKLALWMESEAGQPLDLREIDLRTEWDSVERIVRFLEARRVA